MAGPLNLNYDAAEFNITRDQQFDRVAITASTLYFAQFYARARMYVTNIIIGVRSIASVAAMTAVVGHRANAAAAFSVAAGSLVAAWISATSVGSYQTVVCNRTLAAGEFLGIQVNDAKGKIFVMYEFQILPA
jgi:hypothetical protein